jgi:hypothetical protein
MMADEHTIRELNNLKTSIHTAQAIVQGVYEALSVTEVANKELYAELSVWVVEFSTRIGDLMVLKAVVESMGANTTTDEATLMILGAMMPMRETHERLIERTTQVMADHLGSLWKDLGDKGR